ncbi:hypothetical protein QFW96_02210 [Saccharopolyspora sp. TS4A08]|uniref:Uncharacterized protein n=1 Tax=Saccharopolyspora ipomoeae TaxID=3042027 RepID=A0ABT6PIV9_9PSEU|nr:hypothetical protein [Saccharopolyspora sp. TS4A08]MDI2027401.1 hypothetical protein [Saccharopolyspora sp. TS4A08]
MIPVVLQPPERFVQVAPDKLRSVRTRSALVGLMAIPFSLIIGAVGVPWTFFLPTSYDPLSFVVAGMLGVTSLFSLLIGALALASRGCVKTGQLNVTSSGNLRRAALVFWIGNFVTSGFGLAAMVLVVSTSGGSSWHPPVEFRGEVLAYLVLLVLPAIVGGAAWITMTRTLRP